MPKIKPLTVSIGRKRDGKRVKVGVLRARGVGSPLVKSKVAVTVELYLEPDLLERIEKFAKKEDASVQAFCYGAVVGHVTDLEIDAALE